MTRSELLARLESTLACPAEGWLEGDQGAALEAPGEPVPAAVLVGLVPRTAGPTVLLTQRTHHLKDHAGQISFPGGRVEPGDDSMVAAALREAEEEIGLPPHRAEVLGTLAPYRTITGYNIHPIVGWVEPPINLKPDPFEVEEAFEVPLAFILDPANHRRQAYRRGNCTRFYYVLPYEERFIWGATAGILVNLASLLRS